MTSAICGGMFVICSPDFIVQSPRHPLPRFFPVEASITRNKQVKQQDEMVDVIFYGYDSVPNPQKVLQVLALFQIPYKYIELPAMLPRPDLDSIGVTYRRTPLLSIDSDLYVDTALIIEKLCDIAAHSDVKVDTANHVEYLLLGDQVFRAAVGLLPAHHPIMSNAAFLKDRSALTGMPFDAKAFTAARPQTLSQMLAFLALIQKNFLKDGKDFILGGTAPSTADIYLYFSTNWGLRVHDGASPEISKSSHPVIFNWLESVRQFLKGRKQEEKIEFSQAKAILTRPPKHEYAKFVKHNADNPLKLQTGQEISVTPVDTGKSHPQYGTLISLNDNQVCLRNKENVVMHFPRLGYVVAAAA